MPWCETNLAKGAAKMQTDNGRTPLPHWPVVLEFHRRLLHTEALIFGPFLPDFPWTDAMEAAKRALKSAKAGKKRGTKTRDL